MKSHNDKSILNPDLAAAVLASPMNVDDFATILEFGEVRRDQVADSIISTNDVNSLRVGSGNDSTAGSDGNDTLYGYDGNDTLSGEAGADQLSGGEGHDLLLGGTGRDTLIGGGGSDTYYVDDTHDDVIELQEYPGHNQGIDVIYASASYSLTGRHVEFLTLIGSAAINATGNSYGQTLTGNVAANRLDGLGGADTMVGGGGNDTYVVDQAGDQIIEMAGEGTDLVESAISYTLGAEFENLTLTGTGNINGTGNAQNNVLTGNSRVNTLAGGAGDDTYYIAANYSIEAPLDHVVELNGEGTDAVYASVTYTLSGPVENLILTGSASGGTGNSLANLVIGTNAHNWLNGMAGYDRLEGGGGSDILDGGTGADTLIGGTGDDSYYVDTVGDVVVEAAGQGNDEVFSAINYTLAADLEHLTLTGSADLKGTGNALNNQLKGNSGNNTLAGGLGDDTYIIQNDGDLVIEASNAGTDQISSFVSYSLWGQFENLHLLGDEAIDGTGNGLANQLYGNAANNRLDGGANHDRLNGSIGADTLIGGTGNDTFVVDTIGDTVIEVAGGGRDLVESAITWTLTANFENLILTGSATGGTGNNLANSLTGNAYSNVLDGRGGADTLIGGAGNDAYYVNTAGDVVVETAGQGTDEVFATIDYTLGANIENLTLTGSANLKGTGNALNNLLSGNSGNNTLAGGLGDDTYVVGSAGDIVIEASNAGVDTVRSSVTYSLAGQQIENLSLTGGAAIYGTGNSLANILTGNSGANLLDGGEGDDRLDGGANADILVGGTGNDTYVVDNAGDTVTEAADGGHDTVESSISWTLSEGFENLTLTRAGSFNATGNSLANTLTGYHGNNILDGSAGSDTMAGGYGSDTYYVDDIADMVVENPNQGTDLVYSSVSFSLFGGAVENLILTGTADADATGTDLVNTLVGNDGSNVLNGKAGKDTLTGGLGADIFLFETGSAKDTITDFSAAQNDLINVNAYTGGVANASLVAQVGSNVVITFNSSNTITVLNATQADVLAHMVW